jgi:purine-binding chemotaxis protein CheW
MAIICKIEGSLLSLIVDSIGDVVMLHKSTYESAPDTIPSHLKKFISGVYKMDNKVLSVVDIDSLYKELIESSEQNITKKAYI